MSVLINGAKQKPRFLLCGLKKAMGEAEIDKAPVELYPDERVRHGRRAPDLPAEQDSGAQQGLFQHLASPADNPI